MAFKDCCCGLCAWFSVVGAFTYSVLAIMLFKRNQPVIEHKFKIEFEDDAALNASMIQMIILAFIMIAASAVCFGMSTIFANQLAKKEENDQINKEKSYGMIFRDELITNTQTADEKLQEAFTGGYTINN